MKNKNKNILNDIKGTGFKTPDNYFVQFEKELQNKIKPLPTGFKAPDDYFKNFEANFSKEDKLASISSIKTPGFKTPDNYFKNVKIVIDARGKSGRVISLNKRSFILKSGLAIAASLLLFFSISKYSFNNDTVNTLADNEIEAWMEEGLISFNTFEIEDVFSDEDLNLIAEETDEISDYLKYTDIEILLLEN
ncbi:MAG: hypothetical protein J7K34_08585 [Flavobacteriaceae bacterium]|nr:hypothetical protein [Flavobacteriaceae bacterium]